MKTAFYTQEPPNAIWPLPPAREQWWRRFFDHSEDALLVCRSDGTIEEANPFIGSVTLEGVDLDRSRSFTEMYASNPEPPIPVWITYHWMVFRARGTEAKLTVSDWPAANDPQGHFGQEQTFNFLEIQPYHE